MHVLSAWRAANKVSCSALARSAGIRWQTLQNIERGGGCRTETLEKIAKATAVLVPDGGLSVAEILGASPTQLAQQPSVAPAPEAA